MIKVLILICAVTTPRAECQRETALSVLQGPDVKNELLCGLHGQAYLAGSALAQSLTASEYVKVTCQRTTIGRENVG